MITVHDTNATFVKFILTMQYSVSEVKNTASKMLRFGMPNVLPLEITFLFRNHKLGSFSSSLFKFILLSKTKNQDLVLVFLMVFF